MKPATRTHTPGPWTNDDGLVCGMESREQFRGPSIDIFDANQWPAQLRAEAMANARLIAAAPDMLAALTNLVEEWGDDLDDPFWNAARDALEKAAKP